MLKLVKDADNEKVNEIDAMLRHETTVMLTHLINGIHALRDLSAVRPDLYAPHADDLMNVSMELYIAAKKTKHRA